MEAKLSDVQVAELVALLEVEGENFYLAVLSDPEIILYLMAASTTLRLLRELDIHLLDSHFENGARI